MANEPTRPTGSQALSIAGFVVGGLPALFLVVDAVMKLIRPALVIEATTKLGYDQSVIVPLGIVLLVCTVLYLVPRTAVPGAILLTGYLGGAVATHVRAGGSGFEIFFPVMLGAMLWAGLALRDAALGNLLFWRR